MKGKALPSYIVRNSRGVLYFVRRGQGWTRLETQFPEGAPIPTELHLERERLLSAPTPVKPGTDMAAVIRHYIASRHYRDLAPRTRVDYDKRIGWLEPRIGTLAPKHITKPHVIAWQDKWARNVGPHEANYRFRVLRILLAHAERMGLLPPGQNPAKGVEQVRYEKRAREPWPAEKVEAFRERFAIGTTERLIFELLLGTGQRIGDVLRMQWGHVEGDHIRVRQSKTAKRMTIPMTDHLRAALAAETKRGVPILIGARGRPMGYRVAAQTMLAARRAIGADEWDQHALRYTAAAELCLAGCSDEDIAAVTGQSEAMVRHYTASVRQKVRAIRAQKSRNDPK